MTICACSVTNDNHVYLVTSKLDVIGSTLFTFPLLELGRCTVELPAANSYLVFVTHIGRHKTVKM